MPTYDYKCDACGKAFEKFQSMTAPVMKKCPHCGKKKLRRLIGTGAGLIFKGSGFYITDYRDSGYSEKAKADSGETKPAAEGKTETKSETKSDSPTKESSGKENSGKESSGKESKPAESKPAAEKSPPPEPKRAKRSSAKR